MTKKAKNSISLTKNVVPNGVLRRPGKLTKASNNKTKKRNKGATTPTAPGRKMMRKLELRRLSREEDQEDADDECDDRGKGSGTATKKKKKATKGVTTSAVVRKAGGLKTPAGARGAGRKGGVKQPRKRKQEVANGGGPKKQAKKFKRAAANQAKDRISKVSKQDEEDGNL